MAKEKEKEQEPKARNEQWVGGGSESDNERYKLFLEYCEERRNNWARGEQEDIARMKEKRGTLEFVKRELQIPEREWRSMAAKENKGD